MNTTAGKLSDIITIGANVTIPTTHWGTWTGEVLDTRETGPLAPEGEFFVTLKDADGTVQEVRTSRLYTGYLNAAPAPATDAEMIEALEASDTFTVVEDSAHLAELLGMDEAPADVEPVRTPRPDITIAAENMIYAQAVRLPKASLVAMDEWADAVEARRIARGETEDARPRRFDVPVRDRNDVLIGHVSYSL